MQCLIIVLDNPLSHPLLEKLLPTVKYSLHDTSEKVRTAFLDLLIKVKAVRAAKVWFVWRKCIVAVLFLNVLCNFFVYFKLFFKTEQSAKLLKSMWIFFPKSLLCKANK